MNSHSILLRILATDFSERSVGVADDEHIGFGITARFLLVAAATARPQLEALYDQWNRADCETAVENLALCRAMEIIEGFMMPEGLVG